MVRLHMHMYCCTLRYHSSGKGGTIVPSCVVPLLTSRIVFVDDFLMSVARVLYAPPTAAVFGAPVGCMYGVRVVYLH